MMKKAFKHNCMIRPMFFPPSLSSANAGVDMELRQCFVSKYFTTCFLRVAQKGMEEFCRVCP